MRYLTGFSSSNAALLVEPDGAATLYADFRYASRGREVEGVTFVEVSRYLIPALAEKLAGRTIAFEAARLPYSGFQMLEARRHLAGSRDRARRGAPRGEGRARRSTPSAARPRSPTGSSSCS